MSDEGHHSGREISAGGVIFKRDEGGVKVALISTRGGKRWGLPKGLQEDHETLARTAHREVAEETGLDGRIIEKIGEINYFYTFTDELEKKKVFKIVYFFLMEFISGDTESHHDDEVDECRWFGIDEAEGLLKFPDEKGIIKKAKMLINKI
jgi:8-oxo-dGTP diphosphatase